MKKALVGCWVFGLASACSLLADAAAPVRDVSYFLRRMRTVEHLPERENSHTALASTWDRSGANADGTDFKDVRGTTNVIFDAEGPGCIHRLFTGAAQPSRPETEGYLRVDGTRVQVFVDDATQPVFDALVTDFFTPGRSPLPAPLIGTQAQGWTYPGCLLPIPYERHCRVQLTNPEGKNWGSYWQVTYTTYAPGTRVSSLRWPLTDDQAVELKAVCDDWSQPASQRAASTYPAADTRHDELAPGAALEVRRAQAGVVREMRVTVEPATAETLRAVRLVVRTDGKAEPDVDVPVGFFFGHADSGHAAAALYSSLLMGVTAQDAYTRFPMPYADGATVALRNDGTRPVRVRLALAVEPRSAVPANWGRFHAQYREARAASEESPRYGLKKIPAHLVLKTSGRGKYVGVMLRTEWPHPSWWGEGDWLIWTDEDGWPPRYHGTGSEEYFNCGWCLFDRKPVSGFVTIHPGVPTEYSFHLNDAFQFQQNLQVAVETVGWGEADDIIRQQHPTWGSTAYWYAGPAQ